MNTPLIKAAPPAVVESSKCRCTFAQKMVGDGCRYCNPQEYIDRLHRQIAKVTGATRHETNKE